MDFLRTSPPRLRPEGSGFESPSRSLPHLVAEIGPAIYVAFLILFALGLVIAVVISLVYLTSPSSLNH